MAEHSRPAAYADLLAALLAVRSDPATARFDAELARAEAEGRIDGPTARTLRWWQRESLRGLTDHLATVLPDLLVDLRESERVATESVDSSASAWSQASAAPAAGPPPSMATDGGTHLRPIDDVHADELPPAPRLLRPGFAPPTVGADPHRPPATGAPRARLLVSGLTFLAEGGALARDLPPNDPYDRPR
jgi:hypothetical protein